MTLNDEIRERADSPPGISNSFFHGLHLFFRKNSHANRFDVKYFRIFNRAAQAVHFMKQEYYFFIL